MPAASGIFVLAPLAGAAVAGFSYAALLGRSEEPAPLEAATSA